MTTRLATILRNALGVVAVLLTVTTGRAATPSFDSFDTNDFRVVKTTAPWKILSNTANTTNNFTNVVINYINSTIINTNTIITNVNTTIVNTNTTIINEGATIINTNVTQTFSFTTNIIDNSLTIFTNVVEITTNSITIFTNVFVTNSTIFINGTNVAAINPTIGRLPYKSGTNTFDDSSMYFINTNTTGTATLEVTDLANGGVVVSLPSGIVTNIVNGTGALTNDGAGNLGWADISGANLWTNNAGVLEPVNPALQPMVVPGLFVGTNSMTNYGGFVLTNGEVVIASRDTSVGDVDFAQYVQEVSNGVGGKTSTQLIDDHRLSQIIQESVVGGFSFSKFQTTVDDSGAELILYGRPSTGVHLYPSAPWASTNSVMPYTFDTVFPGTFSGVRLVDFKDAGTNVLSIGPQGELFFGPGWTNVLYRDGIFLVYSNRPSGDGTYPGFSVRNPTDSSEVRISVGGGGLAYLTGTSAVGLSDNFVNGNEVRWSSKYLAPVTITNANLGGDGFTSLNPWGGVNQLTNTVWGYVSVVSTNYSRLRVTHTGTNGPIVFDSQSSGIAGPPREFQFRINGSTNLTISTNSGWTGTGTNVFLDDGTFGPVPSTNGANMSGTLTAPYYPRASAPHTLVNGALWEPFAGAIAIGTNSNTIFPAGAYTGMVATHDTAAGEDQELDMFFAATGDGNVHDITTSTNGSSMFWDGISGTGGESVLQLDRRWADIDSRIGLALLDYGVTNSSPLFQSLLLGTGTGSIPDKLPMWMDPLQYGTSSGTYGDEAIYKFGTASAETHRKLMDVSNAGTNLFSIAASGDAILHGHTPASSSETNYVGAITWDANNLYIWTATNVNKKVPLTSW